MSGAVRFPGRIGRPPIGDEPKRAAFNTRLRAEVKRDLEAAALQTGRSLSEEIEERLEASLRPQGLVPRELVPIALLMLSAYASADTPAAGGAPAVLRRLLNEPGSDADRWVRLLGCIDAIKSWEAQNQDFIAKMRRSPAGTAAPKPRKKAK